MINVVQLFVSTMLLTHVLACVPWAPDHAVGVSPASPCLLWNRQSLLSLLMLAKQRSMDSPQVWYWLGSEARALLVFKPQAVQR